MAARLCGWLLALSLIATSAHSAVGRTVGHFAVTSSGSSSYTIPIFTPPGPNGLKPSIALAYSSNGGIGPVGVGWSIAGPGSISRCNKTFAQDSNPTAVKLVNADGYCLNGNRLRLTGGSYGFGGSTYQTEIADFSQITANGTQGNGPASFTVQGKDGLIYEYGNSTDSRVLATGTSTARIWMLNLVRDRSGNKIKFTYKTVDSGTAGTTHPVSVQWTATSHGASTYVYEMIFGYGSNTPPSTPVGYVASTTVIDDDLLTTISISSSGSVVKKYFLGYGASPTTGAYRLQTVTECSDAAGADCLLPTTISYQDGAAGVSTSASSTISGSNTAIRTQYDYNGDGFGDLAYQAGGAWYVAFGSSAGLTSGVSTGVSGAFVPGDYFGIGRDDILSVSGGTWHVYSWNGSSFSASSTGLTAAASSSTVRSADVDGDGKADIIYVLAGSPLRVATRPNTASGSALSFGSPVNFTVTVDNVSNPYLYGPDDQPSASRRLDFNDDGRDDMGMTFQVIITTPYYSYTTNIYVGLMAVAGYSYQLTPTSTLAGPIVNNYSVRFAAWNSDNCTDTLTDTQILIASCSGGAAITLSASALGIADWDGDGRRDMLTRNSSTSTLRVSKSTGSGLGSAQETSVPFASNCVAFAMDADGDAQEDIGCWVPNGSITVYRHNSVGVRPDLATGFADGYGVTQTVSYTTITRSNHSKYSDAVAPNYDYAKPLTIVTSSIHTDGIGGTFTNSYWYYGANMNREGRGFAGFYAKATTDSRTGVHVYEYFRRDFPYMGLTFEVDTYQPSWQIMSSLRAYYTSLTLDPAPNNQRYFPYSYGKDDYYYEVGGSANGNLISTISGSFTYDSWGNVTAASRTVTDNDAGSPYYGSTSSQFLSNTIYPDSSSNWCLGLPSSVSVTSSATGESNISRSQSLVPDYASCRVTAQSIEPSSGNRRVDVNYGFDSFGNVNSVSVTGRTSAGATMSARTSSITWGSHNGTSGGTGQFPVAVANPLGQTTYRTYDSTFGRLATETDPNGIVVAINQYDSFGRIGRATRADTTSTVYSYLDCAIHGCVNGDPASGATGINKMLVIVSERDNSDAQFTDTWLYLDQLDRRIAESTRTLSGAYNRGGRQYDTLGRIERELSPCAWSNCSAYWITNSYDLLGRVTQQSRPQSQSVSTPAITTFAYAGRTQSITDPQGKIAIKILGAEGTLRRSIDHAGYFQNFGYDAAGSLRQVADSLGNTLFTATYSYGIRSFQDYTNDMDLGALNSSYNSLGELTGWSDAKSQNFSMAYDALSRVTSRTELEGTTTFAWGTSASAKNIGRLASVSMTGYSETFGYDSYGRLSQQNIDPGTTSTFDVTYTAQGLLDTVTYPTSTSGVRVKVKYGYQHGLLQSVTDWTSGSAGATYWTANNQNPRGQITQETLGNGVITSRSFDAVTGFMSSIQSGVGGGAGLQNQSYLYDLVGNVTQRQENNLGLTENFYYDDLYRLSYSQLNSVTNLSLNYDGTGNITSRSDIAGGATWTYDTVKRHAVTNVGTGSAYVYDPNGNMTTRGGPEPATISWTSYNYPTSVAASSGETATFSYGPDRQYYKQVYSGPSGTETTYYLGGLVEKVETSTDTDWRHYVTAMGATVAIVSRKSGGTNAVHYGLEDHQGSPSMLTNSGGASVVRESFGAFGLPRDGTTWSGAVPSGDQNIISGISLRGYTGHTMLASMGLVHMNGRMMDAKVGRFLSPDPYVYDPGFTQGFNRYAYVYNNPLSYIDPSGFHTITICPPAPSQLTSPISGSPRSSGGSNPNDIILPEVIGEGVIPTMVCQEVDVPDIFDPGSDHTWCTSGCDQPGADQPIEEEEEEEEATLLPGVTASATRPRQSNWRSYISEGIGLALVAFDIVNTFWGVTAGPDTSIPGTAMIMGARAARGATKEMTKWGWAGSKSWRDAAKSLSGGGTIKDIGGKIPTLQEALGLLKQAGATVDRIEGPHRSPNPHIFPHINFTTASGRDGTVQITGL